MNEHEKIYQQIKDSIKENIIVIDPNTFEPVKKNYTRTALGTCSGY